MPCGGVEIVAFDDTLAPYFRDINAAWIETMFRIEPHDAHVLDNPRAVIVDPGGAIMFARDGAGAVIGTGALMQTRPGIFELTKMGVRETARGSGAGAALLEALLHRAAAMPVDMLYLLTSSACRTAIRLYERAGFVHNAAIMATYGATYARCDVAMRYPDALLAARRG